MHLQQKKLRRDFVICGKYSEAFTTPTASVPQNGLSRTVLFQDRLAHCIVVVWASRESDKNVESLSILNVVFVVDSASFLIDPWKRAALD